MRDYIKSRCRNGCACLAKGASVGRWVDDPGRVRYGNSSRNDALIDMKFQSSH